MNNLNIHLEKLEKEQNKLKANSRNETIKPKPDIKGVEQKSRKRSVVHKNSWFIRTLVKFTNF